MWGERERERERERGRSGRSVYKRREREMRYVTVVAEMILVVTVRRYDE